jgi:LysM repeat protein
MNTGMSSPEAMSPTTYIIAGVAALGIILGGVGFYSGSAAKKSAAQLDQRIADLEQRLTTTADEATKIDGQLRDLYTKTQTAFGQVGTEIQGLKDQLVKKPAPAPVVAQGGGAVKTGKEPVDAGGPAPVVGKPAGGEYKIVSGDTFAKISKKTGKSLSALEKANPGVNPARLKVGQTIKLP